MSKDCIVTIKVRAPVDDVKNMFGWRVLGTNKDGKTRDYEIASVLASIEVKR